MSPTLTLLSALAFAQDDGGVAPNPWTATSPVATSSVVSSSTAPKSWNAPEQALSARLLGEPAAATVAPTALSVTTTPVAPTATLSALPPFDLAWLWSMGWPLGLVVSGGGIVWLAQRRGLKVPGLALRATSFEDELVGPTLKVLSRTQLAGNESLLFIEIEGLDAPRHLLITAGPQGSKLLSDLSPQPAPPAQVVQYAAPMPVPQPMQVPEPVAAGVASAPARAAATAYTSTASGAQYDQPSGAFDTHLRREAPDLPNEPAPTNDWRSAVYRQTANMPSLDDADDDSVFEVLGLPPPGPSYSRKATPPARPVQDSVEPANRPTPSLNRPVRPSQERSGPDATDRPSAPPRPHLEALARNLSQSRRRSTSPDARRAARQPENRRERTEAARALLAQMIECRRREQGA
jgi:hypothetical protein